MGTFRIVITGTGGHGVDRDKTGGETVDFCAAGENTPDAIAERLVNELKSKGNTISEATIHHWPGNADQVLDNLLTGKRLGKF